MSISFAHTLVALGEHLQDEDLPALHGTILNDWVHITVPTDDDVHQWAVHLEREPVMRPTSDGTHLRLTVEGQARGLDLSIASDQVHSVLDVEVPT